MGRNKFVKLAGIVWMQDKVYSEELEWFDISYLKIGTETFFQNPSLYFF